MTTSRKSVVSPCSCVSTLVESTYVVPLLLEMVLLLAVLGSHCRMYPLPRMYKCALREGGGKLNFLPLFLACCSYAPQPGKHIFRFSNSNSATRNTIQCTFCLAICISSCAPQPGKPDFSSHHFHQAAAPVTRNTIQLAAALAVVNAANPIFPCTAV